MTTLTLDPTDGRDIPLILKRHTPLNLADANGFADDQYHLSVADLVGDFHRDFVGKVNAYALLAHALGYRIECFETRMVTEDTPGGGLKWRLEASYRVVH